MVYAVENYRSFRIYSRFFTFDPNPHFTFKFGLALPATPPIGAVCTSALSRKNSSVTISQLLPESTNPNKCLTRCDFILDFKNPFRSPVYRLLCKCSDYRLGSLYIRKNLFLLRHIPCRNSQDCLLNIDSSNFKSCSEGGCFCLVMLTS